MENNANPPLKTGLFENKPLFIFTWAAMLVVLTFVFTISSSSLTDNVDMETMSYTTMVSSQLVAVSIMLLIPAILMAYLYKGNVLGFLQLKKAPSFQEVVLVVLIILSANFFLNYLVELNKLLPLSDALRERADQMQETTMAMQNKFLDFNGSLQFILAMITMSVFPALVEEMYFRGIMVGVLRDMKLSLFHVVFISALLFSMMHFEFYFFIALFFMGAVLALVYYFSRNLWLSIIAHFVNNGLLVILTATNKTGYTNVNMDADPPIYLSIVGIFIFAGAFYYFYQLEQKKLNHE